MWTLVESELQKVQQKINKKMDKTQLQQKITEYFQKLPKEAQDVFSSMGWMRTLEEIILKYNLSDKQTEALGTETMLLLLGIIHNEEYKKIIKGEMGLNEDISNNIIAEVEEKILKTIKGLLSETFESNAISLVEESLVGTTELDPLFSTMPDEVQTAIAQSGWKKNLYEIAKKYKLSIEQMGVLEELTIKVISDEILPNKYEEELTSKITLPKEDISSLVGDVNENILKKIRELMKKEEEIEFLKKEELDEEIPVPPYKEIINDNELKIESGEDEIPKPITFKQTGKPVTDYKPEVNDVEKIIEIPTISKEEILPFKVIAEIPKEVEIPRPTQTIPDIFNVPKNIIEEKLKGTTTSDHSVSDYSTPKISTPSIAPHDPYREAF